MDRRGFLWTVSRSGAALALPQLVGVAPLRAADRSPAGSRPAAPTVPNSAGTFAGHPEPRPGVDGASVLAGPDVRPGLAELFDGIRRIPHVADGIGCHCGCGAVPGMRSLLSCYEGIGMAQFCVICEGEGRLAVELHAEGRSLDEIRAAIDRRFG
jgi:hypothetical protein